MNKLNVERSIWINAPRERVWRAITETEQLRQWWGDDSWEITALETGATVRFSDPNDPMHATITTVDRPREFTLEWPPQAQYHSIAMTTTYRLEEVDGGTQVTVIETGFEAMPDDIREERYSSTMKGYDKVLASLKEHVER